MTAEKALPLWTPAFALLCCAQFFGSAQHALLQPTFPLFITWLGGTPLEVGFVLASFAVTSVVSDRSSAAGPTGGRNRACLPAACGGLVQSVGFLWMYLAIAGIAGGGLLLTIANRAHLR